MKRLLLPAIAIAIALLSSSAFAKDVAVSATFAPCTSSKWLLPVGATLAVEGDVSLGEHFAVGLRGELFGFQSTSSDSVDYDRETIGGWGVGPLVRYRFLREGVVDPYVGARLQLERGVRGNPGSETTHWGLAVGAQGGVDFQLGAFVIGAFYEVDVPTRQYEDFGGVRYPLYIPGLRLGATF